jgi:hypothetical protein
LIGLIAKYPFFREHLASDASIVACPIFESAVCQLQHTAPLQLTSEEANSISSFRLQVTPTEEIEDDTALNIVESARKKQRQSYANHRNYSSVAHIRPTSNIVERLFSRAKFIMTDSRRHMDPDHLNELLTLKFHIAHWNSSTVEACMNPTEV